MDFLEKPFSRETLLATIQRSIDHDAQIRCKHGRGSDMSSRMDLLSPRERQVMETIVAAKGTKQIAAALRIDPKTVAKHRARVLEKLQVENIVEVAQTARFIRTPLEIRAISPKTLEPDGGSIGLAGRSSLRPVDKTSLVHCCMRWQSEASLLPELLPFSDIIRLFPISMHVESLGKIRQSQSNRRVTEVKLRTLGRRVEGSSLSGGTFYLLFSQSVATSTFAGLFAFWAQSSARSL